MAEHAHQLAAILFADIVGYTAMMQEDEDAAVEKVNRFREILEEMASELNGKIIQYYGDGSLLLFQSSTDAVEFAKLIQDYLQESPKVPVRIGIHMGDVLLQKGNVFGDVVNIAARIQAQAPPGGIYVSEIVYRNIANKKEMDAVFVKEEALKNVKDPVRIYEVLTENSQALSAAQPVRKAPVKNSAPANSIAVLPFSNMSSDPEQEYFSDGLTEDIITQLSKIKALKVISRTSVMQYKKNPRTIREIGSELGVSTILEGSVQRSSDQVRITAQLINAATDEHLWADSYDRPATDIFSIQREVAMSIASVLNTRMSKNEAQSLESTPTANLQAYDYYLRGRFLVEKRNKTDVLLARDLFQQAVQVDKSFANAYSGLADTYLLSSYRGYDEPGIMLPLAKKHIDTALALDPSSGEIYASLGYWYHQTFDWKSAELTYRKAIRLNPNQSNVYLWLAILLEAKDERDEAAATYDKGNEVNPLWDYLLQNKINALVNSNRQEEAITLQKHLIEKAAHDTNLRKSRYSELSRLYWHCGNQVEAIAAAVRAGNQGLIQFYRDGNNSILLAEVEEYFHKQQKSGDYISPLWMGLAYAKAGAREKALACFNNAIAAKEPAITLLLIRQYDFLNFKYLNLVQVTRKIKQLVKF
ncbi:MAG TPA: adenylate/guanylate cyclase domain-containing protein [Chitinophagaceae bacterium]|nr:adenylate/guanylate cyclase domain-containing protein [Chitinophagaceae bacterium]